MSKDKSLDTTLGICSKHNIPREIVPLLEPLKKLDFIDEVGFGRFRMTKRNPGNINIKGFDQNRGSYITDIVGEKYEQKIYLTVKSSQNNGVFKPYHVAKIINRFYGRT